MSMMGMMHPHPHSHSQPQHQPYPPTLRAKTAIEQDMGAVRVPTGQLNPLNNYLRDAVLSILDFIATQKGVVLVSPSFVLQCKARHAEPHTPLLLELGVVSMENRFVREGGTVEKYMELVCKTYVGVVRKVLEPLVSDFEDDQKPYILTCGSTTWGGRNRAHIRVNNFIVVHVEWMGMAPGEATTPSPPITDYVEVPTPGGTTRRVACLSLDRLYQVVCSWRRISTADRMGRLLQARHADFTVASILRSCNGDPAFRDALCSAWATFGDSALTAWVHNPAPIPEGESKAGSASSDTANKQKNERARESELEVELERWRNRYSELDARVTGQERKLNQASQRCASLEAELVDKKGTIGTLTSRIKDVLDAHQTTETQRNQFKKERDDAQRELNTEKQGFEGRVKHRLSLQSQTHAKEVNALKRKLHQASRPKPKPKPKPKPVPTREVDSLRAALDTERRKVGDLRDQLEALQQTCDKLKAEVDQAAKPVPKSMASSCPQWTTKQLVEFKSRRARNKRKFRNELERLPAEHCATLVYKLLDHEIEENMINRSSLVQEEIGAMGTVIPTPKLKMFQDLGNSTVKTLFPQVAECLQLHLASCTEAIKTHNTVVRLDKHVSEVAEFMQEFAESLENHSLLRKAAVEISLWVAAYAGEVMSQMNLDFDVLNNHTWETAIRTFRDLKGWNDTGVPVDPDDESANETDLTKYGFVTDLVIQLTMGNNVARLLADNDWFGMWCVMRGLEEHGATLHPILARTIICVARQTTLASNCTVSFPFIMPFLKRPILSSFGSANLGMLVFAGRSLRMLASVGMLLKHTEHKVIFKDIRGVFCSAVMVAIREQEKKFGEVDSLGVAVRKHEGWDSAKRDLLRLFPVWVAITPTASICNAFRMGISGDGLMSAVCKLATQVDRNTFALGVSAMAAQQTVSQVARNRATRVLSLLDGEWEFLVKHIKNQHRACVEASVAFGSVPKLEPTTRPWKSVISATHAKWNTIAKQKKNHLAEWFRSHKTIGTETGAGAGAGAGAGGDASTLQDRLAQWAKAREHNFGDDNKATLPVPFDARSESPPDIFPVHQAGIDPKGYSMEIDLNSGNTVLVHTTTGKVVPAEEVARACASFDNTTSL